MTHSTETTPSVEEWRTAYQAHLEQAVAALTAAGQLRRPSVRAVVDVDQAGATPGAGTEPADWAEFVTLALAGAAANLGGVEAALAGRSGSWEAEGVRQLLHSTVGPDEAHLWEHRTEPLEVTVYVDEILSGRMINDQYDEATDEITARWDAAEAAHPIDYTPHAWLYERDAAGRWVSADPTAPPFSRDAWRDQISASAPAEVVDQLMAQLDDGEDLVMRSVYLFKSPDSQTAIEQLHDARDAALDPIGDLHESLEAQRLREWDGYGQALKATIETAAARLDGLSVPVVVTVDTLTYRPDRERPDSEFGYALEQRLVEAAVMDTPTPDDLPGTPLQRLEGTAPQ
jgi:hypothetical protein